MTENVQGPPLGASNTVNSSSKRKRGMTESELGVNQDPRPFKKAIGTQDRITSPSAGSSLAIKSHPSARRRRAKPTVYKSKLVVVSSALPLDIPLGTAPLTEIRSASSAPSPVIPPLPHVASDTPTNTSAKSPAWSRPKPVVVVCPLYRVRTHSCRLTLGFL